MKTCDLHRHEHRNLPCPWPDCPNGVGAADITEITRHTGARRMTRAEGHFDVSPPPRVFRRERWICDTCGTAGWAWVEAGAGMRMDRCPHRRTRTVWPRGAVVIASGASS